MKSGSEAWGLATTQVYLMFINSAARNLADAALHCCGQILPLRYAQCQDDGVGTSVANGDITPRTEAMEVGTYFRGFPFAGFPFAGFSFPVISFRTVYPLGTANVSSGIGPGVTDAV